MNHLNRTLILLLLCTLFHSCSIEKRRYTPGYHISLKNSTPNARQNNNKIFHRKYFTQNNSQTDPRKIPVLEGNTLQHPFEASIKDLKEAQFDVPLPNNDAEKLNTPDIYKHNFTKRVNGVSAKTETTTSIGGVLLIFLSVILAFAGLIFVLSFTFWNTPTTLITTLLIIGLIAWIFGCYALLSFGKSI